jgi:ribonucleoside-diphosphate reductase alpha chain
MDFSSADGGNGATKTARKQSAAKDAVLPGLETPMPAPARMALRMPSGLAAISDNARKVLERRYLKKDDSGAVIETAEDMFRRVANNIAQADRIYDAGADIKKTEDIFFNLMSSLDFMPNSPTLMNAGRDLQQLSACFVLPIEDSMEDIFDTVKNTALIHKSGGGTGFSFSRLRPRNSRVRSTKGASSGPVSFMSVFNSATEIIKQGGTRRGANMGILRVDHPDILQFIRCKQEDGRLSNFNISVALTQEFMDAVEQGTAYKLRDPRDGRITSELDAREVFDLIVEMAHGNGEPGVIFIDRINENNPTPHIGAIESTNPCGEQPLLPYESCNLGSLNLSHFVTPEGAVDYARLGEVVHHSVHFLDNVIDMNSYPLDKIALMTKSNRKIGLGVMGFADMLIMMGIPYDSEDAYSIGRQVMQFIDEESKAASRELARERGPFPNFRGSKYDEPGAAPIRNATTTTIAPTGTISIIAGCSSGVEPLFAVSYTRTVMDNDELAEVHPLFRMACEQRGVYSNKLMMDIAEAGSVRHVDQVPEDMRKLFVTAHDITPECHIRMQAAFQKHVDNAVSKTVNFRHDATIDDVETVYRLAYSLGCKGVTIYRDGSRENQVLAVNKDAKEAAPAAAPQPAQPSALFRVDERGYHVPRERPSVTKGRTERIITGCGNLYVTINEDENGPCEVFTQMGKSGGCAASQSEAVSRLISLCLRSGIDPKQIVKHLRGIRCHTPSWQNGGMIMSCPDALGLVMDRYLRWAEKNPAEAAAPEQQQSMAAMAEKISSTLEARDQMVGACPDCGGAVEHDSGCIVCRICGFSKC